jgi:tripartite-type tricarboxylate transporter receptor subunit TctC
MYAGRVEVKLASIALLPQMRAGKLRALGVSSAERSPLAPDIPAIAEELPGFVSVSWHGILAPAKTPPGTVQRLNGEIIRILQTAEARNRLSSEGSTPIGTSPAQFKQFLKEERARWSKLVAEANIRTDD